jgi:uncharacterized membrane protein
MEPREWLMKRNCALSPRQLALFYLVLCCVSLGIAIIFLMHGAWLVLCFSVLEMLAVGIAFLIYARHAGDREYLSLTRDCLLIVQINGSRIREYRLYPLFVKVGLPDGFSSSLVELRAQQVLVKVGQYLMVSRRQQFARELQSALMSVC